MAVFFFTDLRHKSVVCRIVGFLDFDVSIKILSFLRGAHIIDRIVLLRFEIRKLVKTAEKVDYSVFCYYLSGKRGVYSVDDAFHYLKIQ